MTKEDLPAGAKTQGHCPFPLLEKPTSAASFLLPKNERHGKGFKFIVADDLDVKLMRAVYGLTSKNPLSKSEWKKRAYEGSGKLLGEVDEEFEKHRLALNKRLKKEGYYFANNTTDYERLIKGKESAYYIGIRTPEDEQEREKVLKNHKKPNERTKTKQEIDNETARIEEVEVLCTSQALAALANGESIEELTVSYDTVDELCLRRNIDIFTFIGTDSQGYLIEEPKLAYLKAVLKTLKRLWYSKYPKGSEASTVNSINKLKKQKRNIKMIMEELFTQLEVSFEDFVNANFSRRRQPDKAYLEHRQFKGEDADRFLARESKKNDRQHPNIGSTGSADAALALESKDLFDPILAF